jgi:hypothetical protein
MKKNNNTKLIFLASFLVFFFISALFINLKYCGFVSEIRSYVYNNDDFYFYGAKYCPGTWKFKSVTLNSLDELSSAEDIVILSKNESRELEEALESKYLSFTKFEASGEKDNFIIYETECQKCKG